MTTRIESVAQIIGSHKLLLIQHLENGFFRDWQIMGFTVVFRLYGFAHEKGAVSRHEKEGCRSFQLQPDKRGISNNLMFDLFNVHCL
jgi:hypothetical protein